MRKADLLSNFIGRGCMGLLALVATPLYVRLLGIDGYGLIGFYMSLAAVCSIADFGVGESFCKESARLAGQELSHVLRTLEITYWLAGALLCLICLFGAPWVAEKWFSNSVHDSNAGTAYLLRLMALSLFFFWPSILYSKGLLGLRAHICNNAVNVFGSVFRVGGSLLILFFRPSIETFFYWQIAASFFHTLLCRYFLSKKLPASPCRGEFKFSVFTNIWKFTVGMGAIGVSGTLLLQSDRVIVSHYFSLETLGVYCFSYTVASSLYYLAHPISTYYYPLFINYVEKGMEQELKKAALTGFRLILMTAGPLALTLIFFGKYLVQLWTSDPSLAEQCAPLITILTIGVFLNCCMTIPFYLLFAWGKPGPIFYQNLLFIIALIPLVILASRFFGIMGVASFYILLNLGYLTFNIATLNRKLRLQHAN